MRHQDHRYAVLACMAHNQQMDPNILLECGQSLYRVLPQNLGFITISKNIAIISLRHPSPRDALDIDLEDLAETLVQHLRKSLTTLRTQEVVLVGYGSGGNLAQLAAQKLRKKTRFQVSSRAFGSLIGPSPSPLDVLHCSSGDSLFPQVYRHATVWTLYGSQVSIPGKWVRYGFSFVLCFVNTHPYSAEDYCKVLSGDP